MSRHVVDHFQPLRATDTTTMRDAHRHGYCSCSASPIIHTYSPEIACPAQPVAAEPILLGAMPLSRADRRSLAWLAIATLLIACAFAALNTAA